MFCYLSTIKLKKIHLIEDVLHINRNTSVAKYQKRMKSNNFQQMLAYTHFLNGEISNPIRLSEIIKKQHWTKRDYKHIAGVILPFLHVSQYPVTLLGNMALEKLCSWGSNS